MPKVPTDYTPFTDVEVFPSTTLFGDSGSKPGILTIAQIIAQIRYAMIYAELLKAPDKIKNIGATVTSYELLAEDNGTVLRFLCSGACDVLIPDGMIDGFRCRWIQRGAGILSFKSKSGAGQSVDGPEGTRSGGPKGEGGLRREAAAAWLVSGYTQV